MSTQANVLARHRILHELGRGATGAVYAARDSTTGALVALKRLDPALLSGPDTAERFLKHARSARKLRHRNIVAIHDAGEAAGTAYVAMEMLEGRNLRSILDEGPLPVARAIRIAQEIACGLAHAHLEGVVHGGIKPQNIIVLRSGAVKITDFGIGQAAPPAAAQAGLAYLSPEQVRGDAVDHRCDVFSLGVLFYEMLTGRRPAEGDAPPPSELNPQVPRALDAIVPRMLARQPDARMPGMPVLLRELERLEDGLGLAPEPATAEREPRLEPPPRARRSIFPALALLLAVLGIGIAGFLYYSSVSRPNPLPPVASNIPSAPIPIPEKPVAAKAVAAEPVVAEPVAAKPGPFTRTETRPAAEETPAERVPSREPAATAQLIVAVSPRGEIYIDGRHRGTTPPITTLNLEPGMHRIEVRSGTRTPYLTYMTVEAGDVRRIRHDFNAKGRPPPSSRRVLSQQQPRRR